MNSSDPDDYTFDCPGCGESLAVNDAMRDALLDRGCVICGTDVTADAFTPAPPRNSSTASQDPS